MPQEIKKDRVKIDAPIENIIELVRGAFEGPETHTPESLADFTRSTNFVEPRPMEISRELPITQPSTSLPTTLPAQSIEAPEDMRAMGSNIGPQKPSPIENLKAMLDNPPLMADNKPSGLRRFGAALAGGLTGFAGGPKVGMETASSILNQPYKEEYQDWLTKTGALEKGANIDINQLRAERSGYAGLASLIRANQAGDVDLQGRIAGAKEGAKTTTDQKDYQFYLKHTDDEEPASFEDFIKDKKAGVERNTSVHLSVKDAREQQIPLIDRDKKSIDTSKLPDNMEYRMMLGGPNGTYWIPDTQTTRTVTMGNVRSVVPSLTPTAPIVSGAARTPTETSREVRGTKVNDKTGELEPSFERQFTISNPQTTGSTTSTGSAMPTVLPPGGQQTAQSQISQQRGNVRPAETYPQTEIQRQDKYIIPSSAAMAQIIGDPKQGFEGLDSFAHLADDKEAMNRVGTYVRLLLDNMTDAGGGEEIGASLGALGAQLSTGGLWSWFKNNTGITQRIAASQVNAINSAAAQLTPEEDRFVSRLIAAAGDVVGFRSVLGGGAYKWSVDRLKSELPIPGYGIKAGEGGSKSYFNRLAAILTSVGNGLRAAGVPDSRLPFKKDFLMEKAKEFTEKGIKGTTDKPKRNITFERVQ